MQRRLRLTPRKRIPRVRLTDDELVDNLQDPVLEYAQAVVEGAEVAGPHVRAACQRHINDLENGAERGLTFDLKTANAVIDFFEKKLRLSEGQFEGKPLQAAPHARSSSWAACSGGSVLTVPAASAAPTSSRARATGESPLIAGIGLYGMSSDKEPGARDLRCRQLDGSEPRPVRRRCEDGEKAPTLKGKITFRGKTRVDKMTMFGKPQMGSFFVPLSRETRERGSGPRPHMALCDEVHEYHDRLTLDLLERGFKVRRQPLLVMITNSGTDRNSVCFEEHLHAVKVAHGDIEDDAAFSYVCCAR